LLWTNSVPVPEVTICNFDIKYKYYRKYKHHLKPVLTMTVGNKRTSYTSLLLVTMDVMSTTSARRISNVTIYPSQCQITFKTEGKSYSKLTIEMSLPNVQTVLALASTSSCKHT